MPRVRNLLSKRSTRIPAAEISRLRRRLIRHVGKGVAEYVMAHLRPGDVSPAAIEKLVARGKRERDRRASELATAVSQIRLTG